MDVACDAVGPRSVCSQLGEERGWPRATAAPQAFDRVKPPAALARAGKSLHPQRDSLHARRVAGVARDDELAALAASEPTQRLAGARSCHDDRRRAGGPHDVGNRHDTGRAGWRGREHGALGPKKLERPPPPAPPELKSTRGSFGEAPPRLRTARRHHRHRDHRLPQPGHCERSRRARPDHASTTTSGVCRHARARNTAGRRRRPRAARRG